jgi:hypothetical protein
VQVVNFFMRIRKFKIRALENRKPAATGLGDPGKMLNQQPMVGWLAALGLR